MESNASSTEPAQFVELVIPDGSQPRCTICGKAFKRMYGLERHIILHDPFRARLEHQCPYEGCKFSSLQKSNVKTHIGAVHEKIKHTCTQPRTADDAFAFDSADLSRCGRIFSDAPALIRHEKRAHGFYRRGAKAKAKRGVTEKVPFRSTESGGSTSRPVISTSAGDLQEASTGTALPNRKMRCWLHVGDVPTDANMDTELDWESDSDRPSRMARVHVEPYKSVSNCTSASACASVATSASASDAESTTTGSASSSLSAPPSPVTQPVNSFFPSTSAFPPAYPPGYYYPCTSSILYNCNGYREYLLSPTRYSQAQTPYAVYSDNENLPIEEWLPPLAEMKRANGTHHGGSEWDGIVTGLSLVD